MSFTKSFDLSEGESYPQFGIAVSPSNSSISVTYGVDLIELIGGSTASARYTASMSNGQQISIGRIEFHYDDLKDIFSTAESALLNEMS